MSICQEDVDLELVAATAAVVLVEIIVFQVLGEIYLIIQPL